MSGIKIGQVYIINGKECKIIKIHKGAKTKKIEYQNGIMPIGFKNKPCSYEFDNGIRLKGSTIKKNKYVSIDSHL